METLSEINAQEAARRNRARRYEDAQNTKTTAQTSLTRAQKRADGYAKQVTLLTKLIDQAALIDPTIDVGIQRLAGSVAGCARNLALDILGAARGDQQRRLDAELKVLVKARSELARAEQTLAELA